MKLQLMSQSTVSTVPLASIMMLVWVSFFAACSTPTSVVQKSPAQTGCRFDTKNLTEPRVIALQSLDSLIAFKKINDRSIRQHQKRFDQRISQKKSVQDLSLALQDDHYLEDQWKIKTLAFLSESLRSAPSGEVVMESALSMKTISSHPELAKLYQQSKNYFETCKNPNQNQGDNK
jgi:hypothetical protein